MLRNFLKKYSFTHKIGVIINTVYYNYICNFISSLDVIVRKIGLMEYLKYSKIKQFENKHMGERCFVVAMGPSLTYDDLDKIKNEVCFGMNSIVKVLDKTQWRPVYYGIQDTNVYEKLDTFIKNEHLQNLFVGSNLKKKFKIPEKSIVYPLHFLNHMYKFPKKYTTKFSGNSYWVVYDGYTITYSLIQIAVYMGFDEIYLLGCDCNYSDDKNNQHFVESGHFDPTYKSAGERMIGAYKVAKDYADNHGIKIYNATRGGMLEVFPRVDLDEVLKEIKK